MHTRLGHPCCLGYVVLGNLERTTHTQFYSFDIQHARYPVLCVQPGLFYLVRSLPWRHDGRDMSTPDHAWF